jgi:hypothetical protein
MEAILEDGIQWVFYMNLLRIPGDGASATGEVEHDYIHEVPVIFHDNLHR